MGAILFFFDVVLFFGFSCVFLVFFVFPPVALAIVVFTSQKPAFLYISLSFFDMLNSQQSKSQQKPKSQQKRNANRSQKEKRSQEPTNAKKPKETKKPTEAKSQQKPKSKQKPKKQENSKKHLPKKTPPPFRIPPHQVHKILPGRRQWTLHRNTQR